MSLIGALLDVLDSMKEKYSNTFKSDIQMNKIQSIFDLVSTLAKSNANDPNYVLFTLAFGLKTRDTCDLTFLLETINNY